MRKDDLETLPIESWRRFLESQRWYGDKGRELRGVRAADYAALAGAGGAPAAGAAGWCLLEAQFAAGPSRLYQVVGRAAGGAVEDALGETPFAWWLRSGFREGRRATRRGEIRFRARGKALEIPEPAGALAGEMSNSLLALGDALVLKLYRRVEPGVHPEVEALEWLAGRGFEHAPRLEGAAEHRPAGGGGDACSLLLVLERLPRPQSLWEVFTAAGADAAAAAELGELAARLGEVTAGLHHALGDAPGAGEALRPDVAAVRETLDALAAARRRLDGRASVLAEEVLARRAELERRLVSPVDAANVPIRTHGDYHLGQVVLAGAGRMAIMDFEGEPALPLAARRRRRPAARDVACLLRSFSYARHCREAGAPATWESGLRERFLGAYLEAIAGAAFVPRDRAAFLAAVEVHELDKAVAEVGYELSHRPGWAWVPLRGVLDLLGRAERAERS